MKKTLQACSAIQVPAAQGPGAQPMLPTPLAAIRGGLSLGETGRCTRPAGAERESGREGESARDCQVRRRERMCFSLPLHRWPLTPHTPSRTRACFLPPSLFPLTSPSSSASTLSVPVNAEAAQVQHDASKPQVIRRVKRSAPLSRTQITHKTRTRTHTLARTHVWQCSAYPKR